MKTKRNTLEVDKNKLIRIHKIFWKKHKILVDFNIQIALQIAFTSLSTKENRLDIKVAYEIY